MEAFHHSGGRPAAVQGLRLGNGRGPISSTTTSWLVSGRLRDELLAMELLEADIAFVPELITAMASSAAAVTEPALSTLYRS
jgi:hypothetical protein